VLVVWLSNFFDVSSAHFRVQGSGFRVRGSGSRVQGQNGVWFRFRGYGVRGSGVGEIARIHSRSLAHPGHASYLQLSSWFHRVLLDEP
jgi:hypothetical protein